MPSPMSFGVAGIHQYSPPSEGAPTATLTFKETIQEMYTIHELKNRKTTTSKNKTITNDRRSLVPTFKST